MTWDTPMTYWLDLDALDDDRATFVHHGPGESFAGFWLHRGMWEDMGRPGRVEISPKPAEES